MMTGENVTLVKQGSGAESVVRACVDTHSQQAWFRDSASVEVGDQIVHQEGRWEIAERKLWPNNKVVEVGLRWLSGVRSKGCCE